MCNRTPFGRTVYSRTEFGNTEKHRSFANQTVQTNTTMKKIFSLLLLLAALQMSYGQNADPARAAADQLIRKYNLSTAKQAEKAYAIQVRKQKNLSEIEALATSDPALYHAKLAGIQQGTQASIGRLLSTNVQRELYRKTQSEQRLLRAEKRRILEAQGVPTAAIESAVLDIYLE